MKFPYIQVPTRDPLKPWKFLPLIPIRIFNESKKSFLELLALLDSGAEKSVFNQEIARALSINLQEEPEENFSGIEGGILNAKVKNIPLQLAGDKRIFEVPVGFIENVRFSAILGQEGFFDRFSITFKRKQMEIEIKRLYKSS